MRFTNYDICAKSAVTEEDASLVVSVPLEEVLNAHSNDGSNQCIIYKKYNKINYLW
jgi:hypothetical protein